LQIEQWTANRILGQRILSISWGTNRDFSTFGGWLWQIFDAFGLMSTRYWQADYIEAGGTISRELIGHLAVGCS
jgi:hypothetical protein